MKQSPGLSIRGLFQIRNISNFQYGSVLLGSERHLDRTLATGTSGVVSAETVTDRGRRPVRAGRPAASGLAVIPATTAAAGGGITERDL